MRANEVKPFISGIVIGFVIGVVSLAVAEPNTSITDTWKNSNAGNYYVYSYDKAANAKLDAILKKMGIEHWKDDHANPQH